VNSWEVEDNESSAVSQYFDLYSSGRLSGFRLDLSGYGRATSADTEDNNDLNRLYSLTMELSSEKSSTSIILGRQFISTLTGPQHIDGLSVSGMLAGLILNTRWGYVADISNEGLRDEEVVGLGFDYLIKQDMYFSLDYSRSSDSDILLQEFLALDWSYSWFRYTKAYVMFNFDLMSRTLHETLIGTRMYFSELFSSTIEFSQNVHTFDSDSIYSVFAVDASETTTITFLLTPSKTTRYSWEYSLEGYQEGGGGRRYLIGAQWKPGDSTYEISLEQHKGYGGLLTEVALGTAVDILPTVSLGIGGDVSKTENNGESEIKSYTVYTGAEWKPKDSLSASCRLERTSDDLGEKSDFAGRLSLSWEF